MKDWINRLIPAARIETVDPDEPLTADPAELCHHERHGRQERAECQGQTGQAQVVPLAEPDVAQPTPLDGCGGRAVAL
ncbi:hypothetical protein [Kribbella amoyensis]|uniref:hypothetical protein n=1 Tax=Kribbella amoyensis TaxID=996641 RepID=UPI0011A1681C|nr:hypothetical protein [Kribbella amoyensis]